ncbi:hypothetical protein ANN_20982 [Periplaneta americana]|uniref:Reverse transcriptase domain-containing protein n=1 Tax=Periplaneta americana TaxID=6978 RepID=A0ABQ8SEE8_PERAM|nr:hypothetical protein ANN_20982 [Periplaneta americana]
MSPVASTESYPAFAHIGLRENPGKNLNQVTFPDQELNPGHLVSWPDALIVTPQVFGKRAELRPVPEQDVAPVKEKDDHIKDSFYEELEQTFDPLPRYHMKILLADFNAKVGREDIFKTTIGKESLHTTSNDNGVRFAVLASSDEVEEELDVNSMWENIRDNIKIAAEQGIGYYETKKKKPWFDEDCCMVVERRKQAKLKFLQDPVEANRDNYFNKRREANRTLRNKKRDYLKEKLNEIMEKKWEYKGTVHQLFIDFKKAYDSVKREVLCDILIEFGIPKKLVRLIKMCLSETYSRVRIELLLITKIQKKISHRKTKVFGFCGNNTLRTKIVIEEKMIEQVNSFTYLGCDLSYISSTDVENKLNKFLRLIGTIKRTLINKVDRQTVLRFYKTLAIATLLYGSETWILTRAQHRRIEAAEMRLLRPLAGFRLQDHKRNEDIRQELTIESITTIIEKYRNNWYDHITRMPNDRIPFKTWCYRPTRRRRVGRPKDVGETSLADKILEAEQAIGLNHDDDDDMHQTQNFINLRVFVMVMYIARDWINLAHDRERWRAYVRAAMNLRVA